MSKSRGNVVAPQAVMNDLGADILRLWVASTDYRGEMNVSSDILNRTADGYRRLRNTARFLLANLDGFDPSCHMLTSERLVALDRWIIDRAHLLQEEVKAAYDSYQFQQIYQKIHHFCVNDLGGFYLDVVKDRQYTINTDNPARRSAQTAMFHVLEALVRWLAPIISYTADEIWSYMPGSRNESVFLETWYQGLFKLAPDALMNREFWQKVMIVRTAVSKELEKIRAKGDIGSALNAEIELYCDPDFFELLNRLGGELHFIFITSNASVIAEEFAGDDALPTDVAGVKLKVLVSEHKKCVRCWHQRYDVGDHEEYPELCSRCVENITSDGEQRSFV